MDRSAGMGPGPTEIRIALQWEHDLEGQKRGNEARTETVMRPALQWERDLEGPTRGNEASAAAAVTWSSGSAAAGARFGATRGVEMGPALQREQQVKD